MSYDNIITETRGDGARRTGCPVHGAPISGFFAINRST